MAVVAGEGRSRGDFAFQELGYEGELKGAVEDLVQEAGDDAGGGQPVQAEEEDVDIRFDEFLYVMQEDFSSVRGASFFSILNPFSSLWFLWFLSDGRFWGFHKESVACSAELVVACV